jgi:hypothetical protein
MLFQRKRKTSTWNKASIKKIKTKTMPDQNQKDTFSIGQTPQAQPAQAQTGNPLNTGGGIQPQTAATPAVIPTGAPTPQPSKEQPAQPHEIKPEAPLQSPVAPITQAQQAPQAPQAPQEKDLDKKLEEELAKSETAQIEEPDKTGKTKKYLIIGLVAIALATGGYFAYAYIFSAPSTPEETTSEENTLLDGGEIPLGLDAISPETENGEEEPTSDGMGMGASSDESAETEPPSEEMKELEDVINELENLYTEDLELYDEAILEEIENLPDTDLPPSLGQNTEEPVEKVLR